MQSAIAIHTVEHSFQHTSQEDIELCAAFATAEKTGDIDLISLVLIDSAIQADDIFTHQYSTFSKRYSAYASRAPPYI